MASNNKSTGGIGFAGALFLVFLTLKLCHVITWSWLWVAAPLWIPLGIAAAAILALCALAGFAWAAHRAELRRRRRVDARP